MQLTILSRRKKWLNLIFLMLVLGSCVRTEHTQQSTDGRVVPVPSGNGYGYGIAHQVQYILPFEGITPAMNAQLEVIMQGDTFNAAQVIRDGKAVWLKGDTLLTRGEYVGEDKITFLISGSKGKYLIEALTLICDLNDDDLCNEADVDIIRKMWGNASRPETKRFDFNADGWIDLEDIVLFRRSYQSHALPSSPHEKLTERE